MAFVDRADADGLLVVPLAVPALRDEFDDSCAERGDELMVVGDDDDADAVAAQPDDGYITDSLGWAYYRLGRYDEAVTNMERAAELMPTDPIINDHLGDAYWAVRMAISDATTAFQTDFTLPEAPKYGVGRQNLTS